MKQAYIDFFGTPDSELLHIFSPYRVCPLGAHVDHQHGLVTGFAIDKGVDLLFTLAKDSRVRLKSETFSGDVAFDIATPTQVRQRNWGDYARGAKFALQKRFKLQYGITGVLRGSIPVGGLSSSAAVLSAYVMAFACANRISLEPLEVMRIASEAEREYIGLNNGMLDHACIALGREDHLLMLDCESNEYRLIPRSPRMNDFEIGVFYSGLTRSLMSSDYNLRVAECKTAAWTVQAYENIPLKEQGRTFLRDVNEKTFIRHRDKMPQRFAHRADHFYSEHKRVREGITAWEAGDLDWFGRLVFESCESSIHNYECGSPELIAIYEAMRETPGIYGGRFSGAGFKGACVALVDPARKDEIARSVRDKYLSRFPQYRDTYQTFFCRSANGARFLEN